MESDELDWTFAGMGAVMGAGMGAVMGAGMGACGKSLHQQGPCGLQASGELQREQRVSIRLIIAPKGRWREGPRGNLARAR